MSIVKGKVDQLLADYMESAEEMAQAWTAVTAKFPNDPAIERLAVAHARYMAITTAMKVMAIAVLKLKLERQTG
jgi:hypothetical protein